MKMPKKMKRAWVKALRSGEYGQMKGRLTNGRGSFCCLGVLQHVVSGGSVEVHEQHIIGSTWKGVPSIEWYQENGILNVDTAQTCLTSMNDGIAQLPRSFKYIADWIERHIEEY